MPLCLDTLHYSSHMYILYSIPSTASCLCRSVPSLIHIFVCTYSLFLYTCVYKVVVLELLGKNTRWLLLQCRNEKHKHFATLALTSANHVYVTNTFYLILIWFRPSSPSKTATSSCSAAPSLSVPPSPAVTAATCSWSRRNRGCWPVSTSCNYCTDRSRWDTVEIRFMVALHFVFITIALCRSWNLIILVKGNHINTIMILPAKTRRPQTHPVTFT